VLAAVIGALAVGIGIWSSMTYDTPSGPSVVVAAATMFALTMLWPRRAPA
jgi:zinc transport system permease protein